MSIRSCGTFPNTALMVVVAAMLVFAAWTKTSAEESMPSTDQLDTVEMKIVGETALDFDRYRKVLVSPTVNPPKPFQGYGGWCGWPNIVRLQNGDLYVTFTAGYDHASYPTPTQFRPPTDFSTFTPRQDALPATADASKTTSGAPETVVPGDSGGAWLTEWDCPTGGRMMWIRSSNDGKTWTRPQPFPLVLGAYDISCVMQLRDGTMLAGARVVHTPSWFEHLSTDPLEFAYQTAAHFPYQTVLFRSDDNGETWYEWSRITGPFMVMDSPYTILEAPDGALLMWSSGQPLPGGAENAAAQGKWPSTMPGQKYSQSIQLVMRSTDVGKTWSTWSVIGIKNFDVNEATAAFLPDGSLGFPSRPTSAWYQSSDGGQTWTLPLRLHAGSARGLEGYNELYNKGGVVVTPDGVVVIVCGGFANGEKPKLMGQVLYSRDSGATWVKPSPYRGFIYDPLSYYPGACVLEDGSIFVVGSHEGVKNKYGPWGAEVVAMRFRIKTAEEGDGIELLQIGAK